MNTTTDTDLDAAQHLLQSVAATTAAAAALRTYAAERIEVRCSDVRAAVRLQLDGIEPRGLDIDAAALAALLIRYAQAFDADPFDAAERLTDYAGELLTGHPSDIAHDIADALGVVVNTTDHQGRTDDEPVQVRLHICAGGPAADVVFTYGTDGAPERWGAALRYQAGLLSTPVDIWITSDLAAELIDLHALDMAREWGTAVPLNGCVEDCDTCDELDDLEDQDRADELAADAPTTHDAHGHHYGRLIGADHDTDAQVYRILDGFPLDVPADCFEYAGDHAVQELEEALRRPDQYAAGAPSDDVAALMLAAIAAGIAFGLHDADPYGYGYGNAGVHLLLDGSPVDEHEVRNMDRAQLDLLEALLPHLDDIALNVSDNYAHDIAWDVARRAVAVAAEAAETELRSAASRNRRRSDVALQLLLDELAAVDDLDPFDEADEAVRRIDAARDLAEDLDRRGIAPEAAARDYAAQVRSLEVAAHRDHLPRIADQLARTAQHLDRLAG